MKQEFICSVCNKDVSDPIRVGKFSGYAFNVNPNVDANTEFMKNHFGVYKVQRYIICAECMLKAYGVKPNREVKDENQEHQADQAG